MNHVFWTSKTQRLHTPFFIVNQFFLMNAIFKKNQTGLMLAAMNGHVLIIRELLHLAGLDLNKCDNEGNTALHLAAQAGVLKQVEDQ